MVTISDTEILFGGGYDAINDRRAEVFILNAADLSIVPYPGGDFPLPRVYPTLAKVTLTGGAEVVLAIGGANWVGTETPADISVSQLPNG